MVSWEVSFRRNPTQIPGTSRPYIFLCAAVVIVFGRTLTFGVVQSDDDEILSGMESGSSPIAAVWEQPYLDTYYRPLVTLSLALDMETGRGALWAFHLTNLLIHMGCTLLLYRLLARLGAESSGAMIGALFFAVNPMAVQAVAWIPGRNDELLAFFALLAFLALLRAESGKPAWIAVHAALYGCALLSKESALVLPLLFALRLIAARRVRMLPRPAIGWGLATLGWFLLRSHALAAAHGSAVPSGWAAAVRGIVEPLGKIFLPLRLAGIAAFDPFALLAGIAAAAAVALLAASERPLRASPAAFGAAWLLLLLLPGSLMHAAGVERKFDYLECRAYAPLAGAAFVAAFAIRRAPRKLAVPAGAALLAAYALIAFVAGGEYRDPLTHWRRVAETADRTPEASFNLGFVLHTVYNDPRGAAGWYRKAIALDSTVSMYHDNLGFAFCDQGLYERAVGEYRKAIALDPADPFPWAHLGRAFLLAGDHAQAEEASLAALRRDSLSADALMTLVRIYTARGDTAAVQRYGRLLRKISNGGGGVTR